MVVWDLPALAEDEPAAWAVIVGSNRAGPGQQTLRFASDDARRVADVLEELGGYDPAHVRLLVDPSAGDVDDALSAMAADLADARDRGQRTIATFYYSGHARAAALDLGGEELALPDLRQRLEDLGATFTLVVLDACQAGAIATAKGVDAAPDFSTNSVAGLRTRGIAVLASSTATELSQESDPLGGSAFTHHLVVGLRGAADLEPDGVVTLDEAYAYAYNRTVATTAETTVGSQHPTLETDLTELGATVLTRPGRASARLEFPAPLEAKVVLEREDSGAVTAEVRKAPDSDLDLALAPGAYLAIVRHPGGRIERCPLALAPNSRTPFAPAHCEPVPAEVPAAKGAGPRLHRLSIELGLGEYYEHGGDAYLDRLAAFGYLDPRDTHSEGTLPGAQVSAVWSPRPHVSLVAGLGTLEGRTFWRWELDGDGYVRDADLRWTTARLGLYGRLWTATPTGVVRLYAQAGAGPAWSRQTYDVSDDAPPYHEAPLGWHAGGAGGIEVLPRFGARRWMGGFLEVGGYYAPTLENQLGETHDTGGVTWTLGLRIEP